MFLTYLLKHYKILLMFLGFGGILFSVFALYDLPLEAVLYAGVLCAVLGVLMFIVGFLGYRKRVLQLRRLCNGILVSSGELPEPRGEVEKTYQELIVIMRGELARIETAAENERRDATDYYTLWAHQIKTPIAAMSLLLQSNECEVSAELSAELIRINQYVDMVLTYLRADSESSDFVMSECELDDIIRAVVRKYARLFILKKLSLDFRETKIHILTDEKWLQFVVEQLVSNALKYTQEGKVSIYARDGALVVEDTGIGIRSEDLPRVFEKGFTGYNGREDKRSTGIGLYLCRRVCDKLGHEIKIESDKTGTRASIEFGESELTIE